MHCDEFEAKAFNLDSLRLRQVLINLLGNAVKFTPECGKIGLSVHQRDRKDGKTLVEFLVTDTGIGIAKENQKKVFESFEQAESNTAKKHGGTGLGLAISRRIVELFGSELLLDSELDKGSNFHFAAWFDETEGELVEKVASMDFTDRFAGKRLLLVDDVEINRMIVATMLEETGIAVEEAGDGVEAADMFKESPEGYYDVILMDVQMPRMDGYEASEAIRGLERPDAKTVPIIALTANAFKEDMDKAASHGMNGHISKPVEMQVLFETLYRALKGK